MKNHKLILILLGFFGCGDAVEHDWPPPSFDFDSGIAAVDAGEQDAGVMDAAAAPKGIGEDCSSNRECGTVICLDFKCTAACDPMVANSCGGIGGLCIPVTRGDGTRDFACAKNGTLATGRDDDDAVLRAGDSARRLLTPIADQDLFQIRASPGGMNYLVDVRPSSGVNVALDVYGSNGEQIGAFDTGGAGEVEGIRIFGVADYSYVLVKNAGTTTGEYVVSVEFER